MLMFNRSHEFRSTWEPVMGSGAVEAYLRYRGVLTRSVWIATISWFPLLFGLGAHIWVIFSIGLAFFAANAYYVFVYGRGQLALAQREARQFLGLSPYGFVPFKRSVGGFQAWLTIERRREDRTSTTQ
jgi:hypothetical protein